MKVKLKKVHNKKRIFLGFFSLFLACLGSFLAVSFLVFRFRPVFLEKAECVAKNKANSIINSAVADSLTGINADAFVNIIFDESNRISTINTDTILLNGIKSKIYDNLIKQLGKSGYATVYIPIGSLTKYPSLQGMGYKIPVKILFDTSFDVDFSETLLERGINQVYYETYIETKANLDIISALIVSETTVTSKIPISQTLIAGTVPTQYWSGSTRR